MFDLHSHILPALDDGPQTLEEALEVARFCANDGITHIAATPHCHAALHYLRDEVLPAVAQFQNELDKAGIGLKILPGSEIQLSDVALYQEEYQAGLLCHLSDNSAFSLLEFSWREHEYPDDAPAHIRWMVERETTPIIAHPERHSFFVNDRARLHGLVEAGAWLQVSVDSLLGRNGVYAQTASEDFLRVYPLCVLATDTHRMSRCSGLKIGYQTVAERLGKVRADKLKAQTQEVLARVLAQNSRE